MSISGEAVLDCIREEASQRGFTRVRSCSAEGAPGLDRFDHFLSAKRHGEMSWLERGRDARAMPSTLLPGIRSTVVLAMDHGWPRPPDPGGLTGKVACYAWGRDYHNLVSKRLRSITRVLRSRWSGIGVYWGVDARPVIERAWAARAGLTFEGKNCMAIVPGHSSHLFLAVLFLDVELPNGEPLGDHCGTCRRCLDACPTDAFVGPGEIDANLCISYLTIEHRTDIPEELRPKIGRWVFGCDDCQDVCPHNPKEAPGGHLDFRPRPGHAWLDLPWVLKAEPETLARHFQGSPLKRCGSDGLKRNAAIVLGNLGDSGARPALLEAADTGSPMVKRHARWALDRL